MDIHILDIQLRFYTTIVLGWWLYQTIFLSSRKVFQGKSVILYFYHTCFLTWYVHPTYYAVGTNFYLESLFSAQPINLVVEEVSRNKLEVQTPITYSINPKEINLFVWNNSILALMKSGAPFFRIDIICRIYLNVKYFSVVCLRICYDKLAVKTRLTTTGHLFAKKLNFCLPNINWNSVALKCQLLKHTSSFLIHVFVYSTRHEEK